MSSFNAKRARAKRPCPLWVDAFQRDTQHLGADEVGGYILLLMAMWTRETCDLPDDSSRLAKICRVSKRLWDGRMGPILRPFFATENGTLISKRLRIEADFVEKTCRNQSDRRVGADTESDPYAKPEGNNEPSRENDEKSDNSLNNNDTTPTVDITADNPRHYPTQQPNNPTKEKEEEGAQARASLSVFEEVMLAVGVDPKKPPRFWRGSPAVTHILSWRLIHGLSDDELIEAARLSRQDNPEPPDGPKALDRFMAAFAKAKASSNAVRPAAAKQAAAPVHTPVDQEALMQFWATKITGPGFVSPSSFSPAMARAMIEANLVTPEQLRSKGISA